MIVFDRNIRIKKSLNVEPEPDFGSTNLTNADHNHEHVFDIISHFKLYEEII